MKIKYFILSGIISSAILSMTVFAEPEKTEKETEPTIAVTEVSKTVQETTSITESTTAAVTTSTTEKTTTPSFYDEILAYVGEENAPVLNENLDNNAMTIDSSTIDYSNKSMYTITTRSGDVFYLIINSDGSVYFLNPVDTADLTAMLSDSNDNKLNENALENIEQFESATENEKTVSSTETETIKNEKKPSMAKNILWIIAAIIISLIVGAVFTFIKKKRQTNKFDNDYFDDDDSDANYSDNDSIVEYEEAAEESDITESTSEIHNVNNDDLEEYIDN
ncbi:MAG: CD1107 family mobile element protein [Oscillospiraceae bacterium]